MRRGAQSTSTGFYIPLERAGGSRQDLSFDGTVPIFAGRVIISKFLRNLIFVPDHSNVLEDVLWRSIGCTEMVGLRANTLWALLVSLAAEALFRCSSPTTNKFNRNRRRMRGALIRASWRQRGRPCSLRGSTR